MDEKMSFFNIQLFININIVKQPCRVRVEHCPLRINNLSWALPALSPEETSVR